MTITRTIYNGVKINIDLTSEELYQAYKEKEHFFDNEDFHLWLREVEPEFCMKNNFDLLEIIEGKEEIIERYRRIKEDNSEWRNYMELAVRRFMLDKKEKSEDIK